MKCSSLRWLVGFSLAILLAGPLLATTGFPTDLKCPMCGETNILYVWASYGSYIYQWPSKFQMIFWPSTDPHDLFLCKKCHFAAFSHDWQKPPEEKLEATRKLLSGIAAPAIPEPEFAAGDNDDEKIWKRMVYTKVPMAQRLEIAEKVYELWGGDDDFWCHFYRVKGYHLQKEKRPAEADAARQKALELALKMLTLEKNQGRRKKLLVITAAMRHYLRDDPGALADLNTAQKLTFKEPRLEDAQNQNVDAYLSSLIKEYVDAIVQGRSTDEKDEP